jgi:glycosyltransferase involved in cell wall biosynthesis
MRIIVNGRFSDRKTGIGRIIENLFFHLQHLDKENEYFIFVNREFKDFIKFSNPNFHLVSNGISAKNVILNHLWTQTGFIYNALKYKADLIILPSITLYIFKIANTIYFQNDLIEYYIPNQKWFRLLFRKTVFPVILRLADKIVGISKNTVNDIKKIFSIPEEKLVTIYCGVNLDLFREISRIEAKRTIEKKYGIENDFILYTGTLTLPQKNLIRLVDAYKILKNEGITQKLVMVGNHGKDSHLIFERVNNLGIEDNVIFTGYVPDEDLPYFYNAASVFCFPSLYEGFGLPVLEAMACGCPVVTSNTSSLPEVAGDAALLVNPENTEEIGKAMSTLIMDGRLRNSCIAKGLNHVQKFSWKNSAEELLNVINSFSKK